ncbi:MAG TPA: hypothetical protein VGJ44_14430 [Kribbellaceae bacterium]
MSPRRKPSKHVRTVPDRPLNGGHQRAETKADGAWLVRRVTGSATAKSYRCPGCDQQIPPVTPHVVAWPEDPSLLSALAGGAALDERRHWHTGCWRRRP